jgi:hypothetical protein
MHGVEVGSLDPGADESLADLGDEALTSWAR